MVNYELVYYMCGQKFQRNDWDRTSVGIQRRPETVYSENGIPYFQGRHIIGRDRSVIGGVYLGANNREAISVDIDPGKGYTKLRELYRQAKLAASIGDIVQRNRVLPATYEAVNSAFKKKSERAVNALLEKYGVGPDQKIALDVFIAEGVGVCRHVSLTCATLLEMFRQDGHIRGEISVDRNGTDAGAHAWCRYTSYSGEVVILDVMQGYFGTLKESTQKAYWDYFRPNDR